VAAAALTTQADVGSQAVDQPLGGAAGMNTTQLDDVPEPELYDVAVN
jgi:hypothetical protein